MAAFLDKLPIEIRNQIYENLLLYRDGLIALNFDGNAIDLHEGEKVGLSTAILRTCKQAYAEGSSVLYGSNHFRYCLIVLLSYSYEHYRPRTSIFQKIKHLEITYRYPKRRWCLASDACIFVETLAELMRFLSHVGCSPNTLCIRLVYHSSQLSIDRWTSQYRHTDPLSKDACEMAFSDIQVGTSISIKLDCFDEDLGAMFEDLANEAKFKERWIVKSDFRKTTVLLDDRRNELWDDFSPPGTRVRGVSYDWDSIRFTWTWTLTPLAKVETKQKPKYLESEATTSSDEGTSILR